MVQYVEHTLMQKLLSNDSKWNHIYWIYAISFLIECLNLNFKKRRKRKRHTFCAVITLWFSLYTSIQSNEIVCINELQPYTCAISKDRSYVISFKWRRSTFERTFLRCIRVHWSLWCNRAREIQFVASVFICLLNDATTELKLRACDCACVVCYGLSTRLHKHSYARNR